MKARLGFACFGATVVLAVACGARTGLEVPTNRTGPDAGTGGVAGSGGAGGSPFPDSGVDSPPDVADSGPDVPDVVDAPFDAPPPVCDDAGVTFIYVVTSQNVLYSYYPPDNSFTEIGTIDCPAAPGQTPYSMSVDRGGTAYVVFTDGHLFRVDTANASCVATPFKLGQHGFVTFGMGFTADTMDPGETLFVAEATFNAFSKGLGSIDPTTFALSFVGPFSTPLGRSELTGSGDGRLFAFSLDDPGPGSVLSQLDPATAAVMTSTPLALGDQNSAFAFAFWGNDFYIFTTGAGAISSDITRYRPADGSLVKLGTTAQQTIVGAGVSTCAPH